MDLGCACKILFIFYLRPDQVKLCSIYKKSKKFKGQTDKHLLSYVGIFIKTTIGNILTQCSFEDRMRLQSYPGQQLGILQEVLGDRRFAGQPVQPPKHFSVLF